MERELEAQTTRPAVPGPIDESGLPTLALALDVAHVEAALRTLLLESWPEGVPRLERVELVKLRAGRRGVLRFVFASESSRSGPLVLIGKIRAKGADRRVDRVARALRARGFDEGGAMGFAVPRSYGCIPSLALHLQHGHRGIVLSRAIGRIDAARDLASRVGSALAILHRHGVAAERSHRVEDELAVLERDLPVVARAGPQWADRIRSLLETARSLVPLLASRPIGPVHRDFHPDQILVEDARLVLLDLDLYAFGDPLLDVGNFVAHLREQALRELGDPQGHGSFEREFLAGYESASARPLDDEPLAAWVFLSLVRHVYIAWRIPERRVFLPEILAACEALEVHAKAQ